MKFLKQIKFEIRNIFKSKFLLIIGILVLASSVVLPIVNVFTKTNHIGGGGIVRPMPIEGGKIYYREASSYYGDKEGPNGQEPIVVDGVTIQGDNPFYWNIMSMQNEKQSMEMDKTRFSSPEVLDLVLAMMDEEIHYYVKFAQNVTTPMDYRVELAWRSIESVQDKFIYEHLDVPVDVLQEAASYRKGLDPASFNKKYIDITTEERQAAYIKVDEMLTAIYAVVEKNDFPQYIQLRIDQENAQIQTFRDNIAIQEQLIIDNPDQEESISTIIEDYKKQIKLIEENNIPLLQFRLEKNIIPGQDIWQNVALSDIENSRNQLLYMNIVSEEDFNKEIGYIQQYGTYRKYVNSMQKQIDQLNNTVIIADKSLKAEKPDMKYVATGARNRTISFLNYSVFVALFAVLLGGWIIASEYQQGTIRLLMIRPKTRTKILMSKFIASIVICIAIYIAGSLLNIVTNGICFGFSDFAFPNYSIGGETNFFAYYLPKMLICMTPILFAFTVAFMLSVVVKNIAVSIAAPIVCFVGSIIAMTFITYRTSLGWLAYTPIPFVQISSFFIPYSTAQQAMQNGVSLNLPYGIGLLVALSAICAYVSIVVFKKRDIAN